MANQKKAKKNSSSSKKKTTTKKNSNKKGVVEVSFKTKSGKLIKFTAEKPSKSRIKSRKPYGYR